MQNNRLIPPGIFKNTLPPTKIIRIRYYTNRQETIHEKRGKKLTFLSVLLSKYLANIPLRVFFSLYFQ